MVKSTLNSPPTSVLLQVNLFDVAVEAASCQAPPSIEYWMASVPANAGGAGPMMLAPTRSARIGNLLPRRNIEKAPFWSVPPVNGRHEGRNEKHPREPGFTPHPAPPRFPPTTTVPGGGGPPPASASPAPRGTPRAL